MEGKVNDFVQKMTKIKPNLFGTHAVRAAWHNPERQIQALYITQQALKDFQSDLAVKGVKRPPPTIIDKKELDRATQGAVHQGIALACSELPETFLSDLLIKATAQNKNVLLMLDQVTDPHNVGAIIRSACAFGACGIIVQTRHAPNFEGVLAKTAVGSLEHIPIIHETNLSRALETLQEHGWFIIGLDERGEKTISQIDTHEKIVLVLGAEGPGLRRNVAEHCDQLVRLPTSDKMPSLNVSNAAAVSLYAICG